MFRKTRIRLVLFNAIVLVLLLNALGSAVYFSMKFTLYSQVDMKLQQIAKHMRETKIFFPKGEKRRLIAPDHRIITLFWKDKGQLIASTDNDMVERSDIDSLLQFSEVEGLATVTVNGQPCRVYTLPIEAARNPAQGPFKELRTVQLVYNLEPEEEMLGSLLQVIGIGSAISILIAVIIGLFLAKRALIPIQSAWEKQQQFVADASHELRTPLSVIQIHLERLFRNPDHTIEQESENIVVGIQETRRLNKLVSDLLTLARSDSDEVQLIKKKLFVDELITSSVQSFRQLAMLKQIQIETKLEPAVEIVADEERVRQLLVILLDNALKYSLDHGLITVECRRDGNWVTVAVSDQGIGITKQDIPFVFDRFFQGDKMRSRTVEGTGLGLSIAKWIVESHGGKIRVESEEGAGATFFVTLPVKGKG